MKKTFAIVLLLVCAVFLAGCTKESPPTQMANPASVFCEAHGNTLDIRTAADGSQSGVCISANGTECDEWAYYRGECALS